MFHTLEQWIRRVGQRLIAKPWVIVAVIVMILGITWYRKLRLGDLPWMTPQEQQSEYVRDLIISVALILAAIYLAIKEARKKRR